MKQADRTTVERTVYALFGYAQSRGIAKSQMTKQVIEECLSELAFTGHGTVQAFFAAEEEDYAGRGAPMNRLFKKLVADRLAGR